MLKKKNEHRFSKSKITEYVMLLLKDRSEIDAAEISINSKRDMIRLIFICIYGRDKRSSFIIIPKDNRISSKGFTFKDFTIKKRVK